jgi:hypothetical protein
MRGPGYEEWHAFRDPEWRRSVERAREQLKPGDRLTVTRCGGLVVTVTFDGWTGGHWICSRTLDDIAPSHVLKRNGQPISFEDPLPNMTNDTAGSFEAHLASDVARKLVGAPRSCTDAHARRYNLAYAGAYAAAVLASERGKR